MPKTLIIPDIHLRHEIAEKIIASEKPDEVIFLGDYFDDFGDTEKMIVKTASWLHQSVNQPNRIHLCGNHDIMYWFKDNVTNRCSGWEFDKSDLINTIVTADDWKKLKFFHVLDGWLLSHGGIHPAFISSKKFKERPIFKASMEEVVKMLENASVECLNASGQGRSHWFTRAGHSRGGSQPYGGLLWCDWRDEFCPVKGIHQIVGHTPVRKTGWIVAKPESKFYEIILAENLKNPTLTEDTSYNINLDTSPGSQVYGVYDKETKEFSVRQSLQ